MGLGRMVGDDVGDEVRVAFLGVDRVGQHIVLLLLGGLRAREGNSLKKFTNDEISKKCFSSAQSILGSLQVKGGPAVVCG